MNAIPSLILALGLGLTVSIQAASGLKMPEYAPLKDSEKAALSVRTLDYSLDTLSMQSVLVVPAAEVVGLAGPGTLPQGVSQVTGSPSPRYPAVLVCYDWMGPSEYFTHLCMALASKGYVAMVADPYGTAVRPKNTDEAGVAAKALYNDGQTFRKRLARSLEILRQQPEVDTNRVAAIGYCFGGTAVLELARSGADLVGVVSFHGGLGTNFRASEKPGARILVLNGDIDPLVSDADIQALRVEMNTVGADWTFVSFGGAVHSFTSPNAAMKGIAEYHKPSAFRSWRMMSDFLSDAFQSSPWLQ